MIEEYTKELIKSFIRNNITFSDFLSITEQEYELSDAANVIWKLVILPLLSE